MAQRQEFESGSLEWHRDQHHKMRSEAAYRRDLSLDLREDLERERKHAKRNSEFSFLHGSSFSVYLIWCLGPWLLAAFWTGWWLLLVWRFWRSR